METRPLRLSDAPALSSLCAQLGYPSSAAQLEGRLRALLGSPADRCLGAIGPDGGLLGWIHVQGRRLLESEPFAEIVGLVVEERLRSQGVGSALVPGAEDWARSAGFAEIRVRSNVVRERAHAFYRRQGYLLTKTAHVFVKSTAPVEGTH